MKPDTFMSLAHARCMAILLFLTAASTAADADILNYKFSGWTAAGSTLDLGGGAVDISGVPFTVVGMTINDIDMLRPGVGDSAGAFAATSTYIFGGFGNFSTDFGGDVYSQGCDGNMSITCVVLGDLNPAMTESANSLFGFF